MSLDAGHRTRQLGLDFHATPAETFAVAANISMDWDTTAVLRYEFPFALEVVTPDQLRAGPGDLDRLLHVDFVADVDAALAMTADEYRDSYLGRFFVAPGEHRNGYLRASSIAGASRSDDEIRKWTRLRSSPRRRMHKGATAIRADGLSGPWVPRSYTDGALSLARDGVRMMAAIGGVSFRFDLLDGAVTDQ